MDIPINVCGVTADVIGLLNPAAGNDCANSGGATASGGSSTGTNASGGSSAGGSSSHSPGIGSGNTVQLPVNVPINACGLSVNVIGAHDGAKGNECSNGGGSGTGNGGGSSATGSSSDSPGIASGNTVQVPINVPVNLCGDTVNVIGLHNSAKDNECSNSGGNGGGSSATGSSSDSPGILSGNTVQLPIDVPVNACGDTVNVIGLLDSAKDNSCSNGGPVVTPPPPPPTSSTPGTPGTPSTTPGGPGSSSPGSSQGGSTSPGSGNGDGGGAGFHRHARRRGLMLAPIGAAMVGGGARSSAKSKPQGLAQPDGAGPTRAKSQGPAASRERTSSNRLQRLPGAASAPR